MVAELSNLEKFAAKVSELLPLVSKAASFAHYTHHTYMKETLCTRVSNMCIPHYVLADFFNPFKRRVP